MQKDVDTLSITCVSALQLKLDLFFKIKAPIYDGGGGGTMKHLQIHICSQHILPHSSFVYIFQYYKDFSAHVEDFF